MDILFVFKRLISVESFEVFLRLVSVCVVISCFYLFFVFSNLFVILFVFLWEVCFNSGSVNLMRRFFWLWFNMINWLVGSLFVVGLSNMLSCEYKVFICSCFVMFRSNLVLFDFGVVFKCVIVLVSWFVVCDSCMWFNVSFELVIVLVLRLMRCLSVFCG